MKRLITIIAVACNLLLLANVALSNVLRETGCPPEDDITPCVCNNSPYTVLNCSHIMNDEDLRTAFSNSERYTYKEVHIEYSLLQFLPHDMFENTAVKNLYLKNVTLASLFDSPPESLAMLENLYIENTRVLSGSQWELLEPFTELRFLTIYYNSIRTLDADFSKYVTKNLQQLTLYATDTRKIKPGVLTEFTNLNKIAMDACKLTELTRDMFTTPFDVKVLHFNDNKITSIPGDLFTQMPNLQTLGLRNNGISTIPQSAFDGNMARIEYVWLSGNPLKCDCLLQWIVQDKPEELRGSCCSPKRLYNVELKDLTTRDFNC